MSEIEFNNMFKKNKYKRHLEGIQKDAFKVSLFML
nr:MAG TPA: hypothetical protein [Caudoviricetes sp.]